MNCGNCGSSFNEKRGYTSANVLLALAFIDLSLGLNGHRIIAIHVYHTCFFSSKCSEPKLDISCNDYFGDVDVPNSINIILADFWISYLSFCDKLFIIVHVHVA